MSKWHHTDSTAPLQRSGDSTHSGPLHLTEFRQPCLAPNTGSSDRLLDNRPALASYAPQHELTFTRRQGATRYDVRRDVQGPPVEVLDEVQRLLDANLRVSTTDISGFQQVELSDISWWVAREAVLNALVHRDYFLHQSIHLILHDGRAEITSPGGFTGGVTARNVLRHPPVRRSPLLAEVRR